MANPDLSIIIVTWNTADITLKCIQTINKFLGNKINYEIIIVDNNSQDNTVLKIKNCETCLPAGRLKIIQNPTNSGFAKGNNIGVKKAKGKYFFFLNSDMELTDNHLVGMLNLLKNDPKIGIIGPKFLNIDLTPQGSVFPPQTAINAFKEFFLKIKNSYSKYTPNSKDPISVWSVSGGAILIKKDLFEQVGGWNEKYFIYFEDLDLCRAIRNLNKKIIFYPLCKVIHRHGASGKSLANTQNQWRRLIPGSIKFHGKFNHYLINSIIWFGQKFHSFFG